jgi:2,5-diamino-6-(ribosylamino)-4(3H)-pyrimidinone 5'-phosphate reductase
MSGVRPRVLVNFATSIDGKITTVPELRRGPFTVSRHPEDHRRMRQIRALADAILIGATNLRLDDPDLALADDERARRRAAAEPEPFRVVVTRRGEGIGPRCKMFDRALGGPGIVVHTGEMPARARDALAGAATLVSMGEHAVDIPRMLEWMARELDVRTLLCEGGGVLSAEFFAARAVDELFLTLVPRIIGGTNAPTLAEGPGFRPEETPYASLGSLERVGDELYLRYDFRWE